MNHLTIALVALSGTPAATLFPAEFLAVLAAVAADTDPVGCVALWTYAARADHYLYEGDLGSTDPAVCDLLSDVGAALSTLAQGIGRPGLPVEALRAALLDYTART